MSFVGLVRFATRASVSRFASPLPAVGTPRYRFFSAPAALTPQQITERVIEIVKKFDKVDAAKVSNTAHFNKDLGLDSLDAVELVLALEEEFAVEIPDEAADKITSIPEAVQYFATHPHAK